MDGLRRERRESRVSSLGPPQNLVDTVWCIRKRRLIYVLSPKGFHTATPHHPHLSLPGPPFPNFWLYVGGAKLFFNVTLCLYSGIFYAVHEIGSDTLPSPNPSSRLRVYVKFAVS